MLIVLLLYGTVSDVASRPAQASVNNVDTDPSGHIEKIFAFWRQDRALPRVAVDGQINERQSDSGTDDRCRDCTATATIQTLRELDAQRARRDD